MPNWSDVYIEFESKDTELLSDIFNKIQSNGYGIDEEFKRPEELIDTSNLTEEEKKTLKIKYGYSSWYEWCIGNWGSKWDMLKPIEGEINHGLHSFEMINNTISISFESPWCSPYKWFEKVCEKYKLSGFLSDMESGMDFCVITEYIDGVKISHIEEDYLCSYTINALGYEEFLDNYESFEFLKEECESDYQKFIDYGLTEEVIKSFFNVLEVA